MKKLSRIIGVSGVMRTGKDSVAALLQSFGYKRVSFADPLRKMAADIDPYISLEDAPAASVKELGHVFRDAERYTVILDVLGYEKAKEIPDFRRFLQRLGTEGVRGNFGQDAWVNLFIDNIENELVPNLGGPKFVVPDVRFPNEADAIRNLGGVVWRTERPGFGGGEHPSEAMVLQIVPDVILKADNLIDLGNLVLEQIDMPMSDAMLASWADSIMSKA